MYYAFTAMCVEKDLNITSNGQDIGVTLKRATVYL